MGATFSVVCLTPQRRLIECIMLFNILLSKKLPICIIRMLLDCYVRQESRAPWSFYYIDFAMSNGVKQGGVLSAILFTLYLDKLLIRLTKSNIGCSINGCYTGALSYDDDIRGAKQGGVGGVSTPPEFWMGGLSTCQPPLILRKNFLGGVGSP